MFDPYKERDNLFPIVHLDNVVNIESCQYRVLRAVDTKQMHTIR